MGRPIYYIYWREMTWQDWRDLRGVPRAGESFDLDFDMNDAAYRVLALDVFDCLNLECEEAFGGEYLRLSAYDEIKYPQFDDLSFWNVKAMRERVRRILDGVKRRDQRMLFCLAVYEDEHSDIWDDFTRHLRELDWALGIVEAKGVERVTLVASDVFVRLMPREPRWPKGDFYHVSWRRRWRQWWQAIWY